MQYWDIRLMPVILLKPITEAKLFGVLEKFQKDIIHKHNNCHEFEINNEKIVLKNDDILYFESLARKIKVVSLTGEYEYYHTISGLEKARIHTALFYVIVPILLI